MSHRTQSAHSLSDPRSDEELVEAARLYVQQLRVFYVHAAVFGAGMTLILGVNLATNLIAGIAGEWRAWWSVWAFIGWSLGVGVHGLVVWLSRPANLTSTWEQERISKMLAR